MPDAATLDAPTASGLRLSRTPEDYQRLALAALAPPRSGDLWAWCQTHLRMRDGSRWQPRRARLLRRWHRVAQARLTLTPIPEDPWAHKCEQLYGVGGAQIAKSTWLHAVLLAALALYPRLMAFYMNRIQDLQETVKTKLRPQLELTRPLADLLPGSDEGRKSALAAGLWTVGVSSLLFKCGAVADDWRSVSPELMTLDEFDRYPADVEGMGDPIDSGIVRQITLPRTRLLLGSTSPTTLSGHGWRRLCAGSHERLLLVCPHCGCAWDLVDSRVALSDGDLATIPPAEIEKRQLARYTCVKNGCLLTGDEMNAALIDAILRDTWCPGIWAIDKANPGGAWTAHPDALDSAGRIRRLPPAETEIRSWWASALYAEHLTLNGYAKLLARAQQGRLENRQAHTNNHAAEPHIIRVEANPLDVQQIHAAASPANAYLWGTCPVPVLWLVGFQDQQGQTAEASWYPWVVVGFDEHGTGFVLEAGKAMNDAEIDVVEQRQFQVAGQPHPVDLWVRDSGNGNLKWKHYMWAAAQPSRRVLAYGQPRLPPGIPWREEVDGAAMRKRQPKPSTVREWAVAPHHWRTETWDRLTGKTPARRIFLPSDAKPFFLESLTSEERIEATIRVKGGFANVMIWKPRVINTTAEKSTMREDTHWWDGLVGCVEFDDVLRHLQTPADVQYGVIGQTGAT
jgi:hypothetical protein